MYLTTGRILWYNIIVENERSYMKSAKALRATTKNYWRLLQKSDNVDRWVQYIYEEYLWPAAMNGCDGVSMEIECNNQKLLYQIKDKLEKTYFYVCNIKPMSNPWSNYTEIEVNWGEDYDQE